MSSSPASSPSSSSTDFASLPLTPATLANLQQLGYLTMTPIQAASLPVALLGKDLIAQAKTGSGKTAAFAIPLLANLNARRFAVQAMVLPHARAGRPGRDRDPPPRRGPRRTPKSWCCAAVCRCATRSPAWKTARTSWSARRAASMTTWRAATSRSRRLNTLVLDEADRMLDMGFFDDIVTVAKLAPKSGRPCCSRATYPEGIAEARPAVHEGRRKPSRSRPSMKKPRYSSAGTVPDSDHDEARLVRSAQVLRHFRPASTLAFCNTKSQCRALVAAYLQDQGFSALALFGELEQRERDQVLVRFANRSCPYWWPPTWPRAAWTSRNSRWSSTSTSRPTPRCTSTA